MRHAIKAALALLLPAFLAGPALAAARNPVLKQPDEIIVRYRQKLSDEKEYNFLKKFGMNPYMAAPVGAEENASAAGARHSIEKILLYRYKAPDPSKILQTIAALAADPAVEYSQPNYYRYVLATTGYTPLGTPDDPIYRRTFGSVPAVDKWGISSPNQWGFNITRADLAFNSGFISQLPMRQVIVAVLDTGVKADHPDLVNVLVPGRNIRNPAFLPDDDDTDGGHGTHVAGIIAAETNNTVGMAGAAYCHVSWTARVVVMPVKIMDSVGEGTDFDAAAGIIWAADNGAKVINISVGGPDESRVLQDAVNYAYDRKGCVIVAAAGNNDSSVWYPAACSNVISVAASTWEDKRAAFSNYGKIDVSAPGVDIWSCTNWESSTTLPAYYSGSGTSFAAPLVSGLAALILLQNPGYGPDRVRETIERSVVDIGAAGYDKYTGWGRIDFVRALSADYNTPEKTGTYNWPNPFSPGMDLFTRIVFQLEAPAAAALVIFDAAGSVVWEKELAAAQTTAGDNVIKWDGRNRQGKTVGNGTYFYIVKTEGKTGRNKILVLN